MTPFYHTGQENRVRKPQRGDRVELVATDDAYTELRPGDQGTVAFVDNAGTAHVKWDSGAYLGLLEGVDDYRVLGVTP